MKEIKIVAPVKKPDDIDLFAKETSCREYYVYYKKFLNNNFDVFNMVSSNVKVPHFVLTVNFE